jgi:hypothetical protein
MRMQEESYSFKRSLDVYQYEFFSEGPKGRIRKMIHFQCIDDIGEVYNLAFGDWSEENANINDYVKSNNGDRQKVLVTVSLAVLDFMESYPTAMVVAQGSTTSRTRLYQMAIRAFWNEISERFHVRGYINNQWESFKPKCNYEAFLLEHK